MMPHTNKRDTLLIGLGNSLRRDDGLGSLVAQILAQETLPDNVEVVDGGTPGLGLVNLMADRQRVIAVDAADMGRAPGEIVCFDLDSTCLLGDDTQISVHGAGVRDGLLLAEALQVLPDQVIIVGVQPADLGWGDGLSPPVQAALPHIVQTVLEQIGVAQARGEPNQATLGH